MAVELLPTVKVKDGDSYRIINEADRQPEDEIFKEPKKGEQPKLTQEPKG